MRVEDWVTQNPTMSSYGSLTLTQILKVLHPHLSLSLYLSPRTRMRLNPRLACPVPLGHHLLLLRLHHHCHRIHLPIQFSFRPLVTGLIWLQMRTPMVLLLCPSSTLQISRLMLSLPPRHPIPFLLRHHLSQNSLRHHKEARACLHLRLRRENQPRLLAKRISLG